MLMMLARDAHDVRPLGRAWAADAHDARLPGAADAHDVRPLGL